MQQGKRVGVTAQSHKAIHELLASAEDAARDVGFTFKGWKKCSARDPGTEYDGEMVENIADNDPFPGPPDVQLLAGTSWLFSREQLDQSLDYLFIDEAGQCALADAVAVATAAGNLVLLGDPQQLAQVTQAVHPGDSGTSVLEHLLGDETTIPPERGLFLDRSFRMHPDVCRFVSDVMYEGRLESIEACARRAFDAGGEGNAPGQLTGTGIRYLPVTAQGNSRESVEEAEVVAVAFEQLLAGEVTETEGPPRPLRLEDILVVTPYNAQVRALTDRLPEGARVGTVDKFQGQEAQVVFFSMATSSGAELPRNLEFLFSRNRLNVAISRAKCLAVLVCSPELLQIRCRTVEQMRMVNALCRAVEVAGATTDKRPPSLPAA
jgi:superfamily I DNA and/or RNA helicase